MTRYQIRFETRYQIRFETGKFKTSKFLRVHIRNCKIIKMTRYQTGFETGKPSLKPACMAKSTDKNVILYHTNLHIYNNTHLLQLDQQLVRVKSLRVFGEGSNNSLILINVCSVRLALPFYWPVIVYKHMHSWFEYFILGIGRLKILLLCVYKAS